MNKIYTLRPITFIMKWKITRTIKKCDKQLGKLSNHLNTLDAERAHYVYNIKKALDRGPDSVRRALDNMHASISRLKDEISLIKYQIKVVTEEKEKLSVLLEEL